MRQGAFPSPLLPPPLSLPSSPLTTHSLARCKMSRPRRIYSDLVMVDFGRDRNCCIQSMGELRMPTPANTMNSSQPEGGVKWRQKRLLGEGDAHIYKSVMGGKGEGKGGNRGGGQKKGVSSGQPVGGGEEGAEGWVCGSGRQGDAPPQQQEDLPMMDCIAMM